jgi:hypothetical protein
MPTLTYCPEYLRTIPPAERAAMRASLEALLALGQRHKQSDFVTYWTKKLIEALDKTGSLETA